MDTLCTTYLLHQATPQISCCPMTPSEQPLPRPALLQSNSCCSGGGKSAQPTGMPEIVPQLSKASQLPTPGPPSPTSSCDWVSHPTGLGTSTVHQCAHHSHNPVITGGCMQPTQRKLLECLVLVTRGDCAFGPIGTPST